MQPLGLRAFELRNPAKAGYSYRALRAELHESFAKRFKRNRPAWTFFEAQATWYKDKTCWWVMSAKKEQTRLLRLEKLIESSARCKRLF